MNGINNVEAIMELEKYLGKFYEDIIELEWCMSICDFIDCFWCEEDGCFTV